MTEAATVVGYDRAECPTCGTIMNAPFRRMGFLESFGCPDCGTCWRATRQVKADTRDRWGRREERWAIAIFGNWKSND